MDTGLFVWLIFIITFLQGAKTQDKTQDKFEDDISGKIIDLMQDVNWLIGSNKNNILQRELMEPGNDRMVAQIFDMTKQLITAIQSSVKNITDVSKCIRKVGDDVFTKLEQSVLTYLQCDLDFVGKFENSTNKWLADIGKFSMDALNKIQKSINDVINCSEDAKGKFKCVKSKLYELWKILKTSMGSLPKEIAKPTINLAVEFGKGSYACAKPKIATISNFKPDLVNVVNKCWEKYNPGHHGQLNPPNKTKSKFASKLKSKAASKLKAKAASKTKSIVASNQKQKAAMKSTPTQYQKQKFVKYLKQSTRNPKVKLVDASKYRWPHLWGKQYSPEDSYTI